MKHRKSGTFALPALMLAIAAPLFGAAAEPSNAAKQSMADYLVGTWECAHTVGTFSGTYKTSYAKVLDGK
jgi:hypothetical protein